jgi:hypothetical protein
MTVPITEFIYKIRAEFPMDLVSAKRLWDQHGSYEAARADLLACGMRPKETPLIDQFQTLQRELAALKISFSDEIARREKAEQALVALDRIDGPRWIPVSERKPDDEQKVLGYWRSDNSAQTLIYLACDSWVDGREVWRDAWGNEADPPDLWKPWEAPK